MSSSSAQVPAASRHLEFGTWRKVIDDDRFCDLVMQTLAFVVPQAPQGIEQTKPAQDPRHPIDRRPAEGTSPTQRSPVHSDGSDVEPRLPKRPAVANCGHRL